MLNIDLIDNLYASLPKEKQRDLIIMLFKKKQANNELFQKDKEKIIKGNEKYIKSLEERLGIKNVE